MPRSRSRRPQIGDLLIVLHEDAVTKNTKMEAEPYVGVVYKLNYDRHGFESALVEWANKRSPVLYHSERGYPGVNIHNLRNRFRIFRDGEEIK